MVVKINVKDKLLCLTYKERQEWASEIKAGRGCAVCAENRPNCLVFHHLDPINKTMQIGSALKRGIPLAEISTEIELCAVLCANCHLLLHAGDISLTPDMLTQMWNYVK